MTVYRLQRAIKVPDRFTLSLLPTPGAGAIPEVRFETQSEELVLSIRFDVKTNTAALSLPGYEGVILPDIQQDVAEISIWIGVGLSVRVEEEYLTVDLGSACPIRVAGAVPPPSIALVRVIGAEVQSFYHMKSILHAVNWRNFSRPSGVPSTTNPFANNSSLAPGVSFIVRAKNEAENIGACLSGIAAFAQDVVFVDNGSTDDTLKIAARLAKVHENIQVFSYPISVPRVGRAHAEAVMARSNNTLAEYYNWALAKAKCFNFTKWDADFLTIQQNLSEMYNSLDLATRGDNICLYYSGMEVYTDGNAWWVDESTMQHEYRLFSKLQGCSWVDIEPWEEIDQTYLFKSQKIYFHKPIYLEVFRLDRDEFAGRGLYLRDARDRARYNYVKYYQKYGKLPGNFTEVSGPADPAFSTMGLTSEHRRMRNRAHAIWSSIPTVLKGNEVVVDPSTRMQQIKLLILIVNCNRNLEQRERIRRSWAVDLKRLGYTYYFVVGRPGCRCEIVDDVLYLDCPDVYEGLPRKTEAMLSFFVERTDFDFVFKVDDDVVLDADQIASSRFYEHDYLGGVVAGAWGLQADWHFGKCSASDLNQTPYNGRFLGTWYAGGCGYFLSRHYARDALCQRHIFQAELYEDKAVGDALRTSNALVGDLRATFRSIDAQKLPAQLTGDYLLAYDVPITVDYATLLLKIRSTNYALLLPSELDEMQGGSEGRVITDWCNSDNFFEVEMSSELISQ